MASIYRWMIRVLMVLSFAALPGGVIECDLEDGELEVDFDDFDFDEEDIEVDFWYDWY